MPLPAPYKKRINALLEVMLQYTFLNFSQKVERDDTGDELDALAGALNIMAEEIEAAILTHKESEQHAHSLFEYTPYPIWVYDLETLQFLEVNTTAIKNYGYSRQEFLTMTLKDIRPPEEVPHLLQDMQRRRTTEFEASKGWKHQLRNGEIIDVEITSHLIDYQGRKAALVIANNVTQHLATERLLQQKNEELARSNQELEQFAYIASHDLQEPLRTITSFLQLLEKHLDGKLDKDGKEYMNFAIGGATRLKRMIDDLLSYSRTMNQKLNPEEINLNDLLNQILFDLHEKIIELGARVIIHHLPAITADRIKITRLFTNLITNAIKFARQEAYPLIEISCQENEKELVYHVKDNGIGMKKEYHERIFKLFQRLHPIGQYPGTGIGLAECKKIVEMHNGKIWVQSEEGIGSAFYFTLKK